MQYYIEAEQNNVSNGSLLEGSNIVNVRFRIYDSFARTYDQKRGLFDMGES